MLLFIFLFLVDRQKKNLHFICFLKLFEKNLTLSHFPQFY